MLTPQEITHSLFCRGGGGCGRGEGTLASPAVGIAQPPPQQKRPNEPIPRNYCSTSARVNVTTVTNIR